MPDRRVRKLMEALAKTGKIDVAASLADMDRKTARKYMRSGKMPAQMRSEHGWRTRADPFAKHWEKVEKMLREAPELEAKALFDWLSEEHPDVYREGHLRTLQRRLRHWRATEGAPQEVYFPQEHKPGEKMETDFTNMNELEVAIHGEAFPHIFCHCVLTYSNWEWGKVCHSESLLSLKAGVQATFFRLGHIPKEHWTDHSTAATHEIAGSEGGGRGFNRSYLEMMEHFGIEPRTIQVQAPHENGDVESSNGAFKRRVKQHLLLRGHRDFGGVEEYETFLEGVMEKANRLREERLKEDLAAMRVLQVRLLPAYFEEERRVTSWSTVEVARKTYSVPSRLKGFRVKAWVYNDRVEIYYHGSKQLEMPRLVGEVQHAVNYRHVIGSLLRKPGAFRHYRYREDMFPSPVFRWAYDALNAAVSERQADLDYLRILNHAAMTMESQVEAALKGLQETGRVPRWEAVIEVVPVPRTDMPDMAPLKVNLAEYDQLIERKDVPA